MLRLLQVGFQRPELFRALPRLERPRGLRGVDVLVLLLLREVDRLDESHVKAWVRLLAHLVVDACGGLAELPALLLVLRLHSRPVVHDGGLVESARRR